MVGCLNQGHKFLWNRALRIYPAFWMAIGLSALLLMNPIFGWYFDWTSITLIPTAGGNSSYKIPYWTLMFEVSFYCVAYLFILAGGKKDTVVIGCMAWLAIIIAANKYFVFSAMLPGHFVLVSYFNIFFIFGMLAALYIDQLNKIPSALLAVVIICAWGIGDNIVLSTPIAGNLFLALSFSSVILLSLRKLKLPRFELLGDISYGVYLLHVPIALATIEVLKSSYPSLRLSVLWLITMCVAAGGSALFGLLEHTFHSRVIKRKRTLGLTRYPAV